jgi:hypothetical protein
MFELVAVTVGFTTYPSSHILFSYPGLITCFSVAHSISSVAILPCFSDISTQSSALAFESCSDSSLACFVCALTWARSAPWASMAVRCRCSSADRFVASSSRSARPTKRNRRNSGRDVDFGGSQRRTHRSCRSGGSSC